MSMSLVDALRQVDLEAGRTYQCRVGPLCVQVQVQENAWDVVPAPLDPADVMLDPWIDLPAPKPVAMVDVTLVVPVLPDVANIPGD